VRTKQQAEPPKHHATKHLVIPVFFNEPSDLTGWTDVRPVAGSYRLKNVLYSDGSAKPWFLVVAAKKKHSKRERVKKT
jgi:hypothetical protein